ncbi:uncharacterized protein BO95DRAFT_419867 [Aspergillus brunneoviolaceus CBS 621.78]|uniref:Uncharacterized protein n=1 Tax=Aspergillus brunneoviolaceus CBS 621.78 TaxID=1450534 RepID=A0ACD1G131_9EURO|nr:hypothetical protein BO95DRAFT_419867 [Aspergillus brunneoviolaceus CBS 621.78]RAH42908.1 hypothetical protein BO95DRAFT_419867 [Aspergillus brunneoviolaceus CBS 621.78]
MGERTLLACIGCKQRKLKCDGRSPKCNNCTRRGRDCLVEDPATGLHRPRDYMQALEARVAYLERLLQQHQPELVPNDSHPTNSSQGAVALASDSGSAVVEPSPNLDSLSKEVALLCLSAAGREPQFFGPSSGVFFSRIASASINFPVKPPGLGDFPENKDNSSTFRPSRSQWTTPISAVELPSPAKAALLSQAYFNSVHPQYPFLHRPTIQSMEKECLSASASGEISSADPVSLFFVLMTYAIGSLVLEQSETEAAQVFFSWALDRLEPLLHIDGLQSIQALLCCAVYSIRSYNGASLWKLSGMAIRQCVELGYHRSTEKYRSRTDVLTKEISKRCFWVAYDLDCVASFTLGRPKGISDNVIDVELPSDIDDEYITCQGFLQPPRSSQAEAHTTMTGAIHVVRLRQIWSKISDNLYSNTSNSSDGNPSDSTFLERLRLELENWRLGAPNELDTTNVSSLAVFGSPDWFHLAYDYSILLLYRPLITCQPEPLGDMQRLESIDAAFQVCFDCARDICQRYRRLYQRQGRVHFTWGSLHILFLAGLTFNYCIWRSRRLREDTTPGVVVNTCMACTTLLAIIAERWSQASSYRDIFETLSERTITMMHRDYPHGARREEAAVSPPARAMEAMSSWATGSGLNSDGVDWMRSDHNLAEHADFEAYAPFQEWIEGLDDGPPAGGLPWFNQ